MATRAQESKQGNLHEQYRWETSYKYLYLRLLTSRPGRNVDTWSILEVSHPKTTTRENFKQHPGIYSIHYHYLGQHHKGAQEKGRLCTSIIWQLQRHLMDLEVKPWQGQTLSTSNSCKEDGNQCNWRRNTNLWTILQKNLECNQG